MRWTKMVEKLKLLTIAEVARILKVTERTVYNYIKGGSLKAAKIGKIWRIKATDLEMFIEEAIVNQ